MKHIHLPWAFFVKSEILRTSVYNVYGSQNEFVDSVTRVFILRMRSLGQNGPLRQDAVFAVARIKTRPTKKWWEDLISHVQISSTPPKMKRTKEWEQKTDLFLEISDGKLVGKCEEV